MSPANLPTLKIHDPDNPEDFLVINEADFVEGDHVLWGDWTTASETPKRRGRPPGSGKASE